MNRTDLIRLLDTKAASSDTNARDVNECLLAMLDYHGSLHIETSMVPIANGGRLVGMSITADATGEGHMVTGHGLTLLSAMIDMVVESSPFREPSGEKPVCGICGLEPHGAPEDGDEQKCFGDDACCAGCVSASIKHPCLAHGCTSWCRKHYDEPFVSSFVRKEPVR